MANISPHTFTKGLDKDTDFGYISNQSYLDARNLRLMSTEGSTSGSLENIEGNKEFRNSFGLGFEGLLNSQLGSTSWYIVGHTFVKEALILFITENDNDPTAGGNNWIVKVTYSNSQWSTSNVLYTSTLLNFAIVNPIKAVGRYERNDIQKIYWVDGYNSVRFANIADPDLSTQSVDKFDLLASVDVGLIVVDSVISGNIPEGSVQYAYQLYNENGSETPYSSLSNIYSIKYNDDNLSGGLRLFAANVDTSFDNIRIVSLHYDVLNSIPTVRIVEESRITSSTHYFSDVGKYIGELTYEEFSILGVTNLVAKEISTKNNYLFVGNVKEDSFDVLYDTRAYRFNNDVTPTARLYNSDLATYDDITEANWNSYDPISASNPNGTHDCINLFNDLTYRDNIAYQYKYKPDGTLGAEGPNVKIGIDTRDTVIDSVGSGDMYTSGDRYGTTSIAAKFVGYKRNEVYRFGAIFLNDKGQRSPVKWICDFAMPTFKDSTSYNVADYDSAANSTEANVMSLLFNFRNVPDEVSGIEVVRVKRESQDRSIAAQGLMSYVVLDGGGDDYFGTLIPAMKSFTDATNIDIVANDTFGVFYSPEISFGNTISYSNTDKFFLAGKLTETTYWDQSSVTYNTNLNDAHILKYKEAGQSTILADESTIEDIKKIDQYTDVEFNDYREHFFSGLGIPYTHIGFADDIGTEQSMMGTALVCELGSAAFGSENTNLGTSGGYPEVYLVDYVKDIFNSQYGGPGLSNRLNSEYISTGTVLINGGLGFNYGSTYAQGPSNVYGGDTYINMFDCLYGAYPSGTALSNASRSFVNIYFPVESSINLALKNDESFSDIYDDGGAYLVREYPGLWQTDSGVEFEFEEPLYQYNTVYSQESTGYTYFVNNEYDLEREYETRVYVSDKKFNGELVDSWLKFRVNNYIDLDNQYGPLVNLEYHKNELLFWQDKAFGILPVEQRSLISDNSPGTLALGTGGVLTRYDYMSTEVGNQSRFGIIKSETGLYWYDQYNTTMWKYAGGLTPINKLKGLDTYFDEEVGKSSYLVGVYDNRYNDVLFSFVKNQFSLSESHVVTLLYNELFDNFVSIVDTEPTRFIKFYDNSYMGAPDLKSWFVYNVGNYGTFENVTYKSSITLVDNVNYPQIKVYDNIIFASYSIDSNDRNRFGDTFAKLLIYNDYQNTAEWSLSLGVDKNNTTRILPYERRERNFTLSIPRNALTTSQESNPDVLNDALNTTQLFAERIRSNYIVVRFTYSNDNNYKFNFPYVNITYRLSPR